MNLGIVSSRYAKALYKYAEEMKEERCVYEEMQRFVKNSTGNSLLTTSLLSPVLSDEQKANLLQAATSISGKDISVSMKRFIRLIIKMKRTDIMPFMAASYMSFYEHSKSIVSGNLTVANTVSDTVVKRLQAIVESRTNSTVEFNLTVDPSIGAGFILQYGDNRMDASLRGQFERLRQELK